MFLKHLKHHGHGHRGHGHGPHKKFHKHGGKHEMFGSHFKHPGHRMGKDLFKHKQYHGINEHNFERRCFSESDLPNEKLNVETGKNDLTFKKRGHYGRHRRHCWGLTDVPTVTTDNLESAEKDNEKSDTGAGKEPGEHGNVASTSAEEEPDRPKTCCRKGRHYFGHHGGRRGLKIILECPQLSGDTTENVITTEGEKKDGATEQEFERKHHRVIFKGRRAFKTPCQQGPQENSSAEVVVLSDEEECVMKIHHGHHEGRIGHHRGRMGHHGGRMGHHGGRMGHHGGRIGHHGGRKEHHAGRKERGEGRIDRHGGKCDHNQHGRHNRKWRRQGCCILMVDAAVNTGDIEDIVPEENTIPEEPSTGHGMEQDGNQQESQEQAGPSNVDQVLEVTDNLRKSSLE